MPNNNELVNMLRAVIQEELKPVNKELQELRQGQGRLESRMENLEYKTDRIDSGLLKLESRMENEVIDKVRALFDANQTQEDKHNQVIDRLESIEIDTGYLVSRVAKLEKMAK